MALINMTNRAQIHEYIRRLNRGFFLSFNPQFLKFGDLLAGWKLATNAKF